MHNENYAELMEEIAAAKKKVESLKREDSLVFPVFTDLHARNAQHDYAQKLIEVLKLVTKEITYDAVIDLGDNFSMLGRNIHISNGELKMVMEDLLGAIHQAIEGPLIAVNGNHDAIGTDFFKPDFWNAVVKNKFGNSDAKYDVSGSYYYLDYEKAKTRLIALSVPCESDLEAEHPTPVWAFGENQLKWLKDVALDTQNDVILICHVPLYYEDKGDKTQMLEAWDGENVKMSYITDLCGRIEDIDEAVAILEAFHSKSDAKLVACLSGHTHLDSLWGPHEEGEEEGERYTNPLPCYQVVTRGVCTPASEHTQYGVSVDIAVWTPSENELYLIRVGDGEDRKIIVESKRNVNE